MESGNGNGNSRGRDGDEEERRGMLSLSLSDGEEGDERGELDHDGERDVNGGVQLREFQPRS